MPGLISSGGYSYTPENVANKSADVAADAASTIKYPAIKTIVDWVTAAIASAITSLGLSGITTNALVKKGPDGLVASGITDNGDTITIGNTVNIPTLPNADPHVAGQLWDNLGVVMRSAG